MTEIQVPPATYRQWLDCLQYLSEHPGDGRTLDLISGGTLGSPPPEQLIARISNTVSVMLTHCCRGFLHRLDEALAEGDTDAVWPLAVRFRRDVSRCLFYRALPFLPEKERNTLDDGFAVQLESFWNDFMRQMRQSARDSMDTRLEDIAYELGRIRIFADRRNTALP